MAIPRERTGKAQTGFQHLLVQRDFRLIWVAQVAAQLADKFLMFSLIILAYRLSGGASSGGSSELRTTSPKFISTKPRSTCLDGSSGDQGRAV